MVERAKRRRLPDDETVKRLYVKQNMSTVSIARLHGGGCDPKNVRDALLRLGVTLRKRTRSRICAVVGCQNDSYKLRHPINGSLYGTLCAMHRREHRGDMAKTYYVNVDKPRKMARKASVDAK